MLFYKMHTANCCFLNLIILYFNSHAINASNNIFIYTENTGLIEPCIETVCSGFTVKRQLNEICVPGRCECPEERQYCTNSYAIKPNKTYVSYNSPFDRVPLEWFLDGADILATLTKHYVLILIVYFINRFKYLCDQYRRGPSFIRRQMEFFLPVATYFSSIVTLYEIGLRRFRSYFMYYIIPLSITVVLLTVGVQWGQGLLRRGFVRLIFPFIVYFSLIVILDYYEIELPPY